MDTEKQHWKIKRDVLESIVELSKSHYPNEFSGMLIGTYPLIEDIYIIPATKNYANSTVIRMDLVPMTNKIVGSVHSHPSGYGLPSKADLSFFSKKFVNIISYPPYNTQNYRVFNKNGQEISLEIV